MSEFVTRLYAEHDLGMTFLALVIGASGAYATSAMGRQAATSANRKTQTHWLVLAALALSFSIWASSFITIMATRVAIPSGFAIGPMVASFVTAFVLVGLGAVVTLTSRFPLAPAFGGAIAGLAVSIAHYVGMSAFRVAGTIVWNVAAVAASVAVGIVFFILATVVWVRSRSRNPWAPICLFAFAISGDPLVAMTAATISYDPTVVLQKSLIDNVSLAWIVGLITTLIATLTWLAGTLSRKHKRTREAERAQLQQLADAAVEGLIVCNRSSIVWINRSLEDMLAAPRAAYVGRPLESIVALAPLTQAVHGRELEATLRVANEAADAIPVRVIMRDIVMLGHPHLVVAVRDQRERLRAEAEMERLATTDALTNLPNRARFHAVVRRLFAVNPPAAAGFALLSLDLDHFKAVNDRCGHAAGDAVLSEVAKRLVAVVRQGDLVARLGGDEFSILAVTGCDTTMIGSFAERVIDAISMPFIVDGRAHEIGVSIGIAFSETNGDDFESLARCADLALYRAKSEGRNTYRLFEDGMRKRMEERHGLELDLRKAIERDEFVLHYQPQIDAVTGAFTGAEALVRWRHPDRGLVMPGDFIPVLEETNLISRLGAWVLRTACMEAARWPDAFVVSVNVSPLQFRDPTLAATIEAALALAGLPGHRLELEITESVLITEVAHVRALLDRLKLLGVRLSIDDFGTGYSSLGQLRHFAFDRIKIDRSFVRRLPDDPASAAIVRAVVALARGLGIQTTAEGVENSSQHRFVVEAGCNQIQGFFFGRPVSSAALPIEFGQSVLEAA